MNANDIGAELAEFSQDKTVNSFANGSQQDHRRNPDGNAEQGEKTAQALRGDGTNAKLEPIGKGDAHQNLSDLIENLYFHRKDAKAQRSLSKHHISVCLMKPPEWSNVMIPYFLRRWRC
ncbi:MAG: hypothetical protein BWY57_02966 [Betaproteobacteria bacterium ADurb.Bin341]|nr:MAG: hypothetical protein BWY57_02966 [Betaproteobacteria bacterium ADurb.Bin341]